MRKIMVEPEQLESCAVRINQENQDYRSLCSSLMQSVEEMSSAWHGKDNTAFTSQIMKYQSDFEQVSALSGQYADFLCNAARAYRDTQEELAAQAGYLGN